jgi:hypothetical protein
MRPRSLVFAAAAVALPAWALCATGCSSTNVDDLFSAAPAQLPGTGPGAGGNLAGGAAGTAGDLQGGAAGTAGDLQGGAAGTASDLQGGAAGTAGDLQGGAAGTVGGAAGGSTCDPACTQRAGCPDPSCWTATAEPNGQSADLAIDGNEGTRYTTGVLAGGDEWLQVDLCKAMTVVGVNVYTASGTDVAASYTVQVSMDGSTWETVLTSTTPAKQRMALAFSPVTAQYVRVNQTGKMGFWWSIQEFSVECQ